MKPRVSRYKTRCAATWVYDTPKYEKREIDKSKVVGYEGALAVDNRTKGSKGDYEEK